MMAMKVMRVAVSGFFVVISALKISKPTIDRQTKMVINTVNTTTFKDETLSHALWIRLKEYISDV
jgi:hypothetical protein